MSGIEKRGGSLPPRRTRAICLAAATFFSGLAWSALREWFVFSGVPLLEAKVLAFVCVSFGLCFLLGWTLWGIEPPEESSRPQGGAYGYQPTRPCPPQNPPSDSTAGRRP